MAHWLAASREWQVCGTCYELRGPFVWRLRGQECPHVQECAWSERTKNRIGIAVLLAIAASVLVGLIAASHLTLPNPTSNIGDPGNGVGTSRAANASFVMPDLANPTRPLDQAEDSLRALGATSITHQDQCESRSVLVEANWYVASQVPQPGATVSGNDAVVLYARKYSDGDCP